ncbi:MAG TPA: lysophospholipase [Dehalococcoidia bacterium]|nr:lysophospholipase [Dehalococcoidia bacterium]
MASHEVRAEEFAFDAPGGVRLLGRAWTPSSPPRAAIAIVHGYAEHSGRYDWTGRQLAARGYAVYACDLRGHGRSDGERVFVRSFNEHLDDVSTLLDQVRERQPGIPIFLLGHSMGGCIAALMMVTRRPRIDGVLLSGAVLTPARGLRASLMGRVMQLLLRIAPHGKMRPLDAGAVSRDPAVAAAYASDPLVHHAGMPFSTLAALVRATKAIEHRAARITAPVLVMHGSADALVSPRGSDWLHETVSSPDRLLKIYEGLHHEILNEPEREQVLADIAAWLDARTKPAAASQPAAM